MNKLNYKIILACCCGFLFSCSTDYFLVKKIMHRTETMPKVVCEKSFTRDLAYINFTIRAYIDTGYYDYDFYHSGFTKVARDTAVKVYIDAVYYSPDSLKMIAVLAIDVDDNCLKADVKQTYFGNQPLYPHFYDGRSIIGIRDSPKEPWHIYIFKMVNVFGNRNHTYVKDNNLSSV